MPQMINLCNWPEISMSFTRSKQSLCMGMLLVHKTSTRKDKAQRLSHWRAQTEPLHWHVLAPAGSSALGTITGQHL